MRQPPKGMRGTSRRPIRERPRPPAASPAPFPIGLGAPRPLRPRPRLPPLPVDGRTKTPRRQPAEAQANAPTPLSNGLALLRESRGRQAVNEYKMGKRWFVEGRPQTVPAASWMGPLPHALHPILCRPLVCAPSAAGAALPPLPPPAAPRRQCRNYTTRLQRWPSLSE